MKNFAKQSIYSVLNLLKGPFFVLFFPLLTGKFLFCFVLLSSISSASAKVQQPFVPSPSAQGGGLNEEILEKFKGKLGQLRIDYQKLSLDWPLKDSKKILLTRFGSPTLVEIKSPHMANSLLFASLHSGVDITRSNLSIDNRVYSPVSGLAEVISDGPDENAYNKAVVILDEDSGTLVILHHVLPSSHFMNSHFRRVGRGDHVGYLTPVKPIRHPFKLKYSHVHLAVLDPSSLVLVSPLRYLKNYRDTASPVVKMLYLLDSGGNKRSDLPTGSFRVVVEAFDRDNESNRNFEISGISYRITDNEGFILAENDFCQIFSREIDLLSNIKEPPGPLINDFLDLVHSLKQLDREIWISQSVDEYTKNRSFRYFVDALGKSKAANCDIVKGTGLTLQKNATSIRVTGVVFDSFENSAPFEQTFKLKK